MVTITLPRAKGDTGERGPRGPEGPVGPQGEVSRAELTAATSPLATRDGSNVEADAFRAAIGSFPTRAAAIASRIGESDVGAIRLDGYAAPGDRGEALYKRVASEPSHAGKFQSVGGQWWEIAERVLNLRQFGAVLDGVADDHAALVGAIQTASVLGRELVWPEGRALISDSIRLTVRQLRWRAEGCVVECAFPSDRTYGVQIIVGSGLAHAITGQGLRINAGGRAHRGFEIHQPLAATGTTDRKSVV